MSIPERLVVRAVEALERIANNTAAALIQPTTEAPMASTYSTVYKDYQAETFAAAAKAMLLDPEIWEQTLTTVIEDNDIEGQHHGNQQGYCVESWTWTKATKTLRVNFR